MAEQPRAVVTRAEAPPAVAIRPDLPLGEVTPAEAPQAAAIPPAEGTSDSLNDTSIAQPTE